MPVATFRQSSFLWYLDDDTLIPVIRDFPSVPYAVEKWLQDVKDELIYMTRAWDKEKSESPTGIEPMTS